MVLPRRALGRFGPHLRTAISGARATTARTGSAFLSGSEPKSARSLFFRDDRGCLAELRLMALVVGGFDETQRRERGACVPGHPQMRQERAAREDGPEPLSSFLRRVCHEAPASTISLIAAPPFGSRRTEGGREPHRRVSARQRQLHRRAGRRGRPLPVRVAARFGAPATRTRHLARTQRPALAADATPRRGHPFPRPHRDHTATAFHGLYGKGGVSLCRDFA
jgi:hypothetical protein